jgi:hypothetical protein
MPCGFALGTTFSDLIRSCVSRSSLQLSQFGSAQYGEPCGFVGELCWELNWLAMLFPRLKNRLSMVVYCDGFYSV